MNTTACLRAGAAVADVTPSKPQFLYGYPHVERWSQGVHDPLLVSSLYLSDGTTELLFAACDVIYVSKAMTARIRERICASTGIPAGNIMVTATHTHSGPLTVKCLSNEGDKAVPDPDPDYVKRLEDGIVSAAEEAAHKARPAKAGLAYADGSCTGTNRRDPAGPSIPTVPILVVRDATNDRCIAIMMVCSMHPTVLHEDSRLISGDFPAMTRVHVQKFVLTRQCPVIYHTGACGNQSTRHVVRSNTFAEAERLGELLGREIEKAIADVECRPTLRLECKQIAADLPLREFPSVADAEAHLEASQRRLKSLGESGAPRAEVRTAECDVFGAEETLVLARAAEMGRIQDAAANCLPAEIQIVQVGEWFLVGWPGEVFVEFALKVREQFPNAHIISMANGELQGYLVTEEAVQEGGYEASNALFKSPDSGLLLVKKTLEQLTVLRNSGADI